ncbi:MAG: biotin attachment protein [Candidatus Omnitrophica bacterium]|nr:biotin attachment protein [Candidatus Omnitrophota bacterium]
MKEVILKVPAHDVHELSINHWHFEEGDKVEKGQDLVEVSCDGIIYHIPSPASGTLVEVYFEVGEAVDMGDVIAAIEE